MPSLKAIRKRIGSVKSTQQITKAMKMVAAAKLRRAQEAAVAARPYAAKLGELLADVTGRARDLSHPLLAEPARERAVDLMLITSDRGLCGSFNAALIRQAEAFCRERPGATVRLTAVGRKGYEYFHRRDAEFSEHHINLPRGPGHALAERLAGRFTADFTAGKTDAVYIVYSRFRSALSQLPTLERLLPIRAGGETDQAPAVAYIYEPDAAALLDGLLRRHLVLQIHGAFLESIASEHGARMTAMGSATNNAADMIDRLTLQMNRARQAAITTELMEIVSGAEALKG